MAVRPLLVFSTLTLMHSALAAGVTAFGNPAPTHLSLLLYWPLAGAVGLSALWSYARRTSLQLGVGGGPYSYRPVALGYLISLPVIAVLFIPAFFVGMWASLLWPAAILTAIAVRQKNNALHGIAVGLVFLGAVQGLLVAPTWSPAVWVPIAIETAAALGLASTAVVMFHRGRGA